MSEVAGTVNGVLNVAANVATIANVGDKFHLTGALNMAAGAMNLAEGFIDDPVKGIINLATGLVPEVGTVIGIVNGAINDPIGTATDLVMGAIPAGARDLINTVHTVASIIDSGNFTALLPALPGAIGQIAGNPAVGAIIHLISHDHHGVEPGSGISQRPVPGT